MSRSYQFSLFGSVSGRGLLFSGNTLAQYLDDNKTTAIPDQEAKLKVVSEWVAALNSTDAAELSLEHAFLHSIFVRLLGYTLYPSGMGGASLYEKPPSRATHIKRTPDAMLGQFGADELHFTAAVELKTPKTDFDLPQARDNSETPIEQGFYYGRRILGTKWVIVSDMRLIRLYAVQSMEEYEEFNLTNCVGDDGDATEHFRRLVLLLHHDYLVAGHDTAPVGLLYSKSSEQQLAIRDSFYQAYYRIRADLFEAIRAASTHLVTTPTRAQLLQATQRLLDRLLFIYYCEDHPQALIPRDTVKTVTMAARKMPGPSPSKVYEQLKYLFREVDAGSPPSSGIQVLGYNGELFKEHWIIDHIDLPDSLHDKAYSVPLGDGRPRRIQGVWGLYEFDYWAELNEHLLGHIFEESLSDLDDVGSHDAAETVVAKISERKRNGIFYTSSLLSDFLSNSALHYLLEERATVDASKNATLLTSLQERLSVLLSLRVLDPACGSGAFLVSAYREMLTEYWRLRALTEAAKGTPATLFDAPAAQDQAFLLRNSLFGVDLLPQAIEIAKLALWLRSARKGEKVADLGHNLVQGNSLDVKHFFTLLNGEPASFDLVIGNPPWGSEIDPTTHASAAEALGADPKNWDSWELFVMLALRALREGGRLAFVLPDSFLYPDKAAIRDYLLSACTIEKVYNLGPDWFGKNVRMGTVVVQARKGPVAATDDALAAVLAGTLRVQAIQGKVPLTQVEAQRARLIPLARTLASPKREIEVFRGKRDDAIIAKLESASIDLGALCSRARGEEMNKAGTAWECPSCLTPTVPGKKQKGGGYLPKKCGQCGHVISPTGVASRTLVVVARPKDMSGFVPYVDGDDVTRRYQHVTPSKWLDTTISGWEYKDPAIYAPPKILVRQAGVGIVATLDETHARCPQSVYLYRLLPQYATLGYEHEFVLAVLLSRTLTYYVFKKFGEIDPAKAHAKLTHARLSTLPVPKVDFSDKKQASIHSGIVARVRDLLHGAAKLGDAEDRAIELSLRQLWGLTPEDGMYINREFIDVPDSQVVRDLFPNGVPRATTA